MSAVRSVLTTTTLVWLYFVMPLDKRATASGVVTLAAGLVVFAALAGWQVRSITRSRTPGLRAVEVLATIAPFFLLLFAVSYFLMSRSDPGTFTQPSLTKLDALYFTVTTVSTTGFGDIAAVSETARTAVTVQMVVDLALLGAGLRLLLGAVRLGRARAELPASTDTDDTDREPGHEDEEPARETAGHEIAGR